MMKKAFAVLLALSLVFAMAFSTAALTSPQPEDFWKITTHIEGSGEASADPVKVTQNPDGSTTLTATDKDGFFTRWIIDGDYEIVSGDLNSPVLIIHPKSDIDATASFSKEEDWLNIYTFTVGDGTASANPARIKKNTDGTSTLTAVDGKDTFYKWTLECDYDIVSGSLTSRVLVIRPRTDIYATAYFKSSGNPEEKKDEGQSSPKTGDPLFAVIPMLAIALGIAALSVKKIKA